MQTHLSIGIHIAHLEFRRTNFNKLLRRPSSGNEPSNPLDVVQIVDGRARIEQGVHYGVEIGRGAATAALRVDQGGHLLAAAQAEGGGAKEEARLGAGIAGGGSARSTSSSCCR